MSSEAPSTYLNAGSRKDGLSIIWRNSKFRLLSHDSVMPYPACSDDRYLRSQYAVLQDRKETTNVVIVGNCHIVFNWSKPFLKMLQLISILGRMHECRVKWATFPRLSEGVIHVSLDESDCFPAMILSGDFNITPQSPLYHWLVSGAVTDSIEHVATQLLHQKIPRLLPHLSGKLCMGKFARDGK